MSESALTGCVGGWAVGLRVRPRLRVHKVWPLRVPQSLTHSLSSAQLTAHSLTVSLTHSSQLTVALTHSSQSLTHSQRTVTLSQSVIAHSKRLKVTVSLCFDFVVCLWFVVRCSVVWLLQQRHSDQPQPQRRRRRRSAMDEGTEETTKDYLPMK